MAEYDLGTARGRIRLDTSGLSKDVGKAKQEIGRVGGSAQQAGEGMKRFGKRAQDTGKTLSTRMTLPVVGAGAAVISTATKFETNMNRVRAVSGATGKDFEDLEGLAKNLGSTTQFSASEAADGMSFLAMAGFETNEMMDALPGTLNLAAAGQLELAEAADISSNVLTGFGLKAQDIGRVNDVMATTAASANTDVRQLGEAMAYVAPVAASSGISVEEASAAIGGLSDAGIQGSRAGTTLRQVIARLESPSSAAAGALEEMGIKTHDAQGNLLPLVDIVGQFEKAGMNSAQTMEIFGARAGPGMAALVSQGADSLKGMTGDLQNAEGSSQKMADTMMEGAGGGMARLRSAFEGLMLAIADSGLLDAFTGIVNKLGNFFQKLSEVNPQIMKMVVIAATLAAAIGPVLIVGGKLVFWGGQLMTIMPKLITGVKGVGKAMKFLATNPLGIAITAIALITAAVIYLWNTNETFRKVVLSVWDSIKKAISYAWDKVLKPVWKALQEYVNKVLIPAFKTYMDVAKAVFSAISTAIQWAWKNVIKPIWKALQLYVTKILIPAFKTYVAVAKAVFKAIGAVIKWAWDNVIKPVFDTLKNWVMNTLIPTLRKFKDIAKAVWEDVSGLISFLWDNAIKPVFNIIREWLEERFINAFNNWKAVFTAVWNALSTAVRWAWNNVLKPIWSSINEFISNTLAPAFSFIGDVAGNVFDAIKVAVKAAWSVIKPIWDAIADALSNTLGAAFDTFKEVASSALDSVKSVMGSVLSAIGGGIQSFLSTVSNVADTVGMKNLAEVLRGAASSAGSWGAGMHSGGIVGQDSQKLFRPQGQLKPDEEWKILQRGEEVLTGDDPRHVRNVGHLNSALRGDEEGGLIDKAKGALKSMADTALSKVRSVVSNLADPALSSVQNLLENVARGRPQMAKIPIEGASNVVGGIRDWIRGLDKEAEKEKKSREGGPGNANLGGSGSITNRLVKAFRSNGPPGRFTSGYRPGDPGLHGRKRAADFAGPSPSRNPTPAMDKIFNFFSKFGDLRELIYDGKPWNIISGSQVPTSNLPYKLRKAHRNHVHVGMALGGIVKDGPITARIGENGSEAVTPLDSNGSLPVPRLESLLTDISAGISTIAHYLTATPVSAMDSGSTTNRYEFHGDIVLPNVTDQSSAEDLLDGLRQAVRQGA